MKLYLFMSYYKGFEIRAKVEAKNDEDAKKQYVLALEQGSFLISKKDFRSPRLMHTTFEEVDRDITIPVASTKENGFRAEVGKVFS
jgi:hypothetical protein